MTYLQEYDLESNLAKIVKGHVTCKLIVEDTGPHEEEILGWEQKIEMYNNDSTPSPSPPSSWYEKIRKYL